MPVPRHRLSLYFVPSLRPSVPLSSGGCAAFALGKGSAVMNSKVPDGRQDALESRKSPPLIKGRIGALASEGGKDGRVKLRARSTTTQARRFFVPLGATVCRR